MSRLSLLKSLLRSGRRSILSIDLGINYCGISHIETKKEAMEKRMISIADCCTYKSRSNCPEDKILEVSEYLFKLATKTKPTAILLEVPVGSLVYGGGNRGYLVKRADSVCKLRCLYFATVVRFLPLKRILPVIDVKPVQWQLKAEIKKYADSKEWSKDKALKISTTLGYHITKPDEHNSDALCMGYLTVLNSLNGKFNK